MNSPVVLAAEEFLKLRQNAFLPILIHIFFNFQALGILEQKIYDFLLSVLLYHYS